MSWVNFYHHVGHMPIYCRIIKNTILVGKPCYFSVFKHFYLILDYKFEIIFHDFKTPLYVVNFYYSGLRLYTDDSERILRM